MKTVWAFSAAALLVLAVKAHADTVFLKDGQTVWGREVTEEGDTVIVVRPGETLRLPKRDVDRIDRWRLSVPKYYEPPAAGPSASDEKPATAPGAPASPSPMSTADRPAQPQAPAAVTKPAGEAPTTAAPSGQLTPTLLPPPPPPSADKPQ